MKPIFFSADNLLTDCIWLDSTSYGYGINTQQKIKILIVSNLSSSIDEIKDEEWYDHFQLSMMHVGFYSET